MTKKSESLARAAISVTLIILFSKAVGFVREMIMAAYFGADAATDAYNSAYSLFYLPVLLFSSCITSTFVPQYTRCQSEIGQRGADGFCSNSLNMFCVIALCVSAAMFVLARPLVGLIYPGFEGDKLALTVRLSRVMFPALVFFVAGLVLSSLLNAREKYVAAQLTGLPLSFAEIGAAIFFSEKYGISAQAWGVILAGALQIVILLPFLKNNFKYSLCLDFMDKYLKRLAYLALPAMLSMAVNELNHMVDRMLASGLNDGDITAMTYAFKLIMFMMGVLVVPLTTISFSKMSRMAVKNDPKAVIPFIRESLGLLISVMLPLVIVCACQAKHIIRFAYGRGVFSETNVLVTSGVFMFYVIGVPFFGVRDALNRVYHSFEDTKTPMLVAAISMGFNIALNLILRKIMGVNGLALATGIAALIGVILLIRGLNKKVSGVFDRAYVLKLVRLTLANVPVALVSLLLCRINQSYGTLYVFLRLAWVTIAALCVYMISILIIGGRDEFKRIIGFVTPLLKKLKR